MALVRAYLRPDDENTAEKMVKRLLESRNKKTWSSDYLHQTLMALDDNADAFKEYKNLKDEVEDTMRQHVVEARTGSSHQKAAILTPQQIKDLEPEILPEMREETPLSSVLTWQYGANCFLAYYPRTVKAREARDKKKQFWSTGRTIPTDGGVW